MEFEVVFYETDKGESPVEDFLNTLAVKSKAKIVGLLKLLEEKGNLLRMPYSKYLRDEIFELRCIQGADTVRVLYFFGKEGSIILTNAFAKKSMKTPKREIELAIKRRADYFRRWGN